MKGFGTVWAVGCQGLIKSGWRWGPILSGVSFWNVIATRLGVLWQGWDGRCRVGIPCGFPCFNESDYVSDWFGLDVFSAQGFTADIYIINPIEEYIPDDFICVINIPIYNIVTIRTVCMAGGLEFTSLCLTLYFRRNTFGKVRLGLVSMQLDRSEGHQVR